MSTKSPQPSKMAIPAFQFASMPHIHFGWGVRLQLLETLKQQPLQNIVLITGRSIATKGQFGDALKNELSKLSEVRHFVVSGEPSPDLVDDIVKQCSSQSNVVIGLGGGSVMDAAKAIAGLIPSQTSVMEYLEGVGAGKPFNVKTCPFIAVPTTAGTGSETTKNAVLSRVGAFKKSFRDNKLLAKEAWLDPELLTTCPKEVLYSTGMDAFTQLLESYTTLKPNPMTDALAWQGMQLFKGAFEDIDSNDEGRQKAGYSNLMLAASLSGTTLANAGLGAVHGLAGPIGAFFHAPHGVVCARLLPFITQENIQSLKAENSFHAKNTLQKYTQVAELFEVGKQPDIQQNLINFLENLVKRYAPEGLARYGLQKDNLAPVLKNCRSGSMLGNSVVLSDGQLMNALEKSL